MDLVRDQLVIDNLVNADRIAGAFMRRLPKHVSRDDVIQSARLGLVKAARVYKTDSNVPFMAFARLHVHGALVDFVESSIKHGASKPIEEAREVPSPETGAAGMYWWELGGMNLAPIDEMFLHLRFVEGLSLLEVGKSLGFCESRSCQTQRQIIDALRSRLLLRGVPVNVNR